MRVVRTYYVVLGISRHASRDVIRAAYRELAKRLHPDVAGDASTSAFQELSEAYEVLGDADRRRRYDAELLASEARIDEEHAARDWRARRVAAEPLSPPPSARWFVWIHGRRPS